MQPRQTQTHTHTHFYGNVAWHVVNMMSVMMMMPQADQITMLCTFKKIEAVCKMKMLLDTKETSRKLLAS